MKIFKHITTAVFNSKYDIYQNMDPIKGADLYKNIMLNFGVKELTARQYIHTQLVKNGIIRRLYPIRHGGSQYYIGINKWKCIETTCEVQWQIKI